MKYNKYLLNIMESYENFIEYLNNKKKICIVGKGITSENYDKEEYDLYIGIKQAILLLKQKDILVMNDYEGLFGCEKIFKELKYIVCPYFPHIRTISIPELKYNSIQSYANNYGFKGKIVIYNLFDKRNIIIPKLLNITSYTSGDIIFHFLNLLPNKSDIIINLFGIGTKRNDNPEIIKLILNNNIIHKNPIFRDYMFRRYHNKITGQNTDTREKLNKVKNNILMFKNLNIKFN